MMDIELHKTFVKDFKKLSKKIKERFIERKDIFLNNPSDPILNKHKLHGKHKNSSSINISGDVRAIFYLKDNGKTAVFIRIGTHAELYE